MGMRVRNGHMTTPVNRSRVYLPWAMFDRVKHLKKSKKIDDDNSFVDSVCGHLSCGQRTKGKNRYLQDKTPHFQIWTSSLLVKNQLHTSKKVYSLHEQNMNTLFFFFGKANNDKSA